MFVSVVHCPRLPTWKNYAVSTTQTSVYTTVNYTCAENYTLSSGNSALTSCGEDGVWYPTVEDCTGEKWTLA